MWRHRCGQKLKTNQTPPYLAFPCELGGKYYEYLGETDHIITESHHIDCVSNMNTYLKWTTHTHIILIVCPIWTHIWSDPPPQVLSATALALISLILVTAAGSQVDSRDFWVMSTHLEPLLLTWINSLIPAWISNHMPSQVWGEITYSFPNFNSSTIEV